MKLSIKSKTPEELVKRYPISDQVEGWFFVCREQSQCHYVAEGSDRFGRKVSASNTDYESALNECFSYAKETNNRGENME